MRCSLCGEEREGQGLRFVTGDLKGITTARLDPTVREGTQKWSFSNFEPLELWFCQDCWRKHDREGDETGLKVFGIGLVVCVLMVVISKLTDDSECIGPGYLGGALALVGTIFFAIKRLTADYTKLDVTTESKDRLFDTYRHEIPKLVYKARGETHYWDEEAWQRWMDGKTQAPEKTYQSER